MLDLEARRRVWRRVDLEPGLHLRELARRVGMDPNHVKYHLRHLEKHGLVSTRREGGFLVFFPRIEGPAGLQDAVAGAEKAHLAILRRPIPLRIALRLLQETETPAARIAAAMGVARATLHHHLGRMEAAGLVASERRGRDRLVRLVDPRRVAGLLVRYRPADPIAQGFLEAWEDLEFP